MAKVHEAIFRGFKIIVYSILYRNCDPKYKASIFTPAGDHIHKTRIPNTSQAAAEMDAEDWISDRLKKDGAASQTAPDGSR